PVATAAGLTVLSLLDDNAYDTLTRTATRLTSALDDVFAGTGTKVQVVRVGALAGLFFADSPGRDYADGQAPDPPAYAQFFHGMLDRGVFLPPSGYEALFPSLAHRDAEVEAIVEAARAAINA